MLDIMWKWNYFNRNIACSSLESVRFYLDLLSHCLIFLWCTPSRRELAPGRELAPVTHIREGRETSVTFGLCCRNCSQITLEVIKPFNWFQFCSFLLNRSIQENGELKIERKIEEVSLFPIFCFCFFSVCQLYFLCLYWCLYCGNLMLIYDFETIPQKFILLIGD